MFMVFALFDTYCPDDILCKLLQKIILKWNLSMVYRMIYAAQVRDC